MGYYDLYFNSIVHDDIDNGEYELYHHGIKGQKWGVRRTAAQLGHRIAGAASKTGKVLYKGGKAIGRGTSKVGKAAVKATATKVEQVHAENKEKHYYKKLHKKKLSQMTDQEIKDLTNRVKKEAELKDAKYESKVQNARKFYKNVAQQPVNTFLATYSRKAVESMFDNKSDDDSRNKQESVRTEGSSNSKKQKNTSSNIEFEVTTEPAPRQSSKSSHNKSRQQNSQTFDDYFEAEVRREQERKKNPVIIRR